MKKEKDVIILIAEDDNGHADLIINGLQESGVRNELIRFENGKELWDYLNKNKNSEHSYLILLDIKMPIMDGIEVLEKIKKSTEYKETPVIMLTTTDDPREVKNCYALGCNAYITKPVNFSKFAEILKRLGLFIQIIKI